MSTMLKSKITIGGAVDLKEKVKLTATDGHPFRNKGEQYEVHPIHKAKELRHKWAVEDHVDEEHESLVTNGKASGLRNNGDKVTEVVKREPKEPDAENVPKKK